MTSYRAFKQRLKDNDHRALVVISGPIAWGLEQLSAFFTPSKATLWLGDNAFSGCTEIKPRQAQQWLGQQCQQLVINGHQPIQLNALGALSGTVTAGNCAYLLCPPLQNWRQQADDQHLTQHLLNCIKQNDQLALVQSKQAIIWPHLPLQQPTAFEHPHCKTAEQQQAVDQILKVVSGHRRRPLVLTADRGRGKSSALGLAIVELIKLGKQKLLISAPQQRSTEVVFERVQQQLSELPKQLQFIAIDELIRHKPKADLVLIDEAAAIPAPMLTQLLKHYSRLVFTTTISGYEGTGRSFEVRFKHSLNQLCPGWHHYHMQQPIRFAINDPLERFINQALMLDAQAADIATNALEQTPTFSRWDPEQLTQQPQQLSQIIGLLRLSHYKTSPNDLRQLLDGENIQLYSYNIDNQIVAVALIAIEGKFDPDTALQIAQGKRRPKGHLIPQSLCFHSGFIQAAQYSYARVVRIAVHPQIQHQGLGSQLLQQLSLSLSTQGLDFIGSSFGINAPLLNFWQQNQFTVVRLGLTLDQASNEYSALVLKPLQPNAIERLTPILNEFNQQLPQQLHEFNPLLEAKVIGQLLRQQTRQQPLTAKQHTDLDHYIHHNREYEFVAFTLHRWLLNRLASNTEPLTSLDEQQQQLIIDKIIRKQPWNTVVDSLGFSGKKQAAKALKAIISAMN